MRSAISSRATAAALAVAAAACGTWSNDDVAFVGALPASQALHVAIPAQAATPGALQAACAAPGASEVWGWAKPTGDALNGGIDFILGLVDVVKAVPPTERHLDQRIWGPFDDHDHPGKELRITIARVVDAATGAASFDYRFDARPTGGPYLAILEGSYQGTSAQHGSGAFAVHFAALRQLGMNGKDTDPTGDVRVQYDHGGDPRTTALAIGDPQQAPDPGGFGLVAFDYGYTGFSTGTGSFHYAFFDALGRELDVDAAFDATGAGRAAVQARISGATFGFQECWDASACITFVHEDEPGASGGLCPGGACPAGPCPAL